MEFVFVWDKKTVISIGKKSAIIYRSNQGDNALKFFGRLVSHLGLTIEAVYKNKTEFAKLIAR